MNEKNLPWDDLRIVLAIVRQGSLAGAARELGVSHATVFRRLGALESQLEVRLFERHRMGYVPTLAGDDLATTAARVATDIDAVERRLVGQDARLSGTLRVTTTDTLLMGLLSDVLAGFQREYPHIVLEVEVSNREYNLSHRDADIAIRPTKSPPETLVGRQVGEIAQAVYVHQHHLETSAWVGPDSHLGYPALERWMAHAGVEADCRYRVDSMLGMLAGVRTGMGRGVLPCYLADRDDSLVKVSESLASLETPLWLLTHPDLRRTARVMAFFSYLAEVLGTQQARLKGEVSPSKSTSPRDEHEPPEHDGDGAES
ncbi:LysR family transcriptional regulator [Chromohalobacter sarecensis]|uniref:LysR family transcriptional regulator n=1 Tax=Chromohalobacter sarecensis TaxID=245294 RepID=A0ABV9D1P7_9GAMM|nr:LysR family transcriptional regulator [Chromohalobacter sarecensis]MCK0715167.1 LysR family transcriptional regulator [Chromohalobacter sarecensis]